MIDYTQLLQGWTVRTTGPTPGAPEGAQNWSMAADVPSVVHTVLMEHGHLPDPYVGLNEESQHWVGESDWEYSTTFDHNGAESLRTELVFEGLDTVAIVRVNGHEVARTFNQHRSYVFDVTDVVVAGVNELALTFTNVRDYAQSVRAAVKERPNGLPEPFQYVRKSACNFGWDWGPNLVTAGPWRPVYLRRYQVARFDSVRPVITTTIRPRSGGEGAGPVADAHLEVNVDIVRQSGTDADVDLTLTVLGSKVAATIPAGVCTERLVLDLEDVELWWPHDMGAQPLALLTMDLAVQGQAVDTWSRKVGFRHCELKTDSDKHGTSFVFSVNGIDIFTKGANWIPDDCFPSRLSAARLEERLTQAVGANINLIRVWGGGVYESDEFYGLCDSLGLLVWQDFLFACAAYPEDEPIRSEVAAEARDNVTRLMSHPSLVLWNGNNENIWGFWDWKWQAGLEGRSWGWGYYSELLPSIVAEVDPARPYWFGSPYSGHPDTHPNDPRHGTVHIWDVWNELDYSHYANWDSRFVAEFGFQGPPNWSTLASVLGAGDLSLDSAAFLSHQKAENGTQKLERGLSAHLPDPVDFADWHFLTQVNQARAVRFGIEHFRAGWPVCAGSIVWQLNDCWPVTSWAAIDGHGRLKPAWYALRAAYRPRLVTVQQRGDALAVVLINDAATPWRGLLSVERVSLGADHDTGICVPVVVVSHEDGFDVGSRERVEIPLSDDLAVSAHPLAEVLVVRTGSGSPDERILHFYAEDKDRMTTTPRFNATAAKVPGGVEVTVCAETVVRDLVLQADRIDKGAVVDEQGVSLLPGESHVFRVSTRWGEVDPVRLQSWCSYPVLRAVGLHGVPTAYH